MMTVFIKKETLSQLFSVCEISKNTFSYRTLLVVQKTNETIKDESIIINELKDGFFFLKINKSAGMS